MIGRYIPDDTVPQGITAEVTAIYEPPQQSKKDSVLLLKDDKAGASPPIPFFSLYPDAIDALLTQLGLTRVGFIWTNLLVDDTKKLINDREPDCPLLPDELIRMANLQVCPPLDRTHSACQARYRSPWQKSRTGYYGSKFVSVIVHGTDDNGVELDAWMMSNQGVALASEGIIKSSKKDVRLRSAPLRIAHPLFRRRTSA